MILKEIDKKPLTSTMKKYGAEAEKQMAFYLKRAFQNSDDVYIINDLRLVMDDDVAQIDHLVIHKFRFVIIESKSVTSKVIVNEYEEWSRYYKGNTKGIPSPIQQAQRQADFLKEFLEKSSDELLKKRLIFKTSLKDFKFDTMIAISDSGIIERTNKTNIDTVFKADQITNQIKNSIENYEKENNKVLTLSLKVNYQFTKETLNKVADFLLHSHQTKPTKNQEKTYTKKIPQTQQLTKQNDETKQCKKCHSTAIEITYGKYGYYFKCKECHANTSIKLICKNSECKPKLRKEKQTFFKECITCKTSDLYFENIENSDVNVA